MRHEEKDHGPGTAADEREIEVLLVDDHLAVRRGVELLLREHGMRVAGVASSLAEARALVERRRHDVLLLDVHLGEETSLPLVAEMLDGNGDAAIVLYTGVVSSEAGLREAVEAGARGFVLKASSPRCLLDALRTVAAGGTYVDPGLATVLSGGADASLLDALSPRELQILNLLADGFTGEAIAQKLFLSPETVRTHIRNATGKLGARTRVQAVALAVRESGTA